MAKRREQALLAMLVLLTIDVAGDILSDHRFDIGKRGGAGLPSIHGASPKLAAVA
jgi:hypothetical protein